MGNQGMTSSKFTAFFTIALMLVAGLFSTTVVALAGTVTVTPSDVWEGEMNKNFILTYTAEGQISNSAIQVKIPDSLIPDAGTAEEEAAFIESKLTISQSGNVVFGEAADIEATDDEEATVTIHINSMYAGDSVYLRYEGINIQALDVDLSTEELEVVGADNEGPGYEAFEVTTDSGRVGEPVGKIHPQQGSGDATLTPESAPGGSTQNVTLDYISHTTLENVYIWIYTPHNYAIDTEDPAFVMANGEEILLTATGDHGYLSSTGLPAGATQVIVDGGKGAVWGPLSFKRGDTFSRTIYKVSITDKPGAYTWDVHLATVDPVDRAGVVDGIGERNPNGLLGLTWSNHLVSPDLQVLDFSTDNVASGTGMVTVTPSDVWEGEMNKNFIITYTAEGQMYRSAIQVKIPDSLIPDAGTAEEEAAFIESKLTISQSGNVVFGDAADIEATDDEEATVTIHINSMYAGDSVYLRYEGINVQALDVDLSTEELEVIGADNEGPGYEAFEVFTDSDGDEPFTFTDRQVGEPVGKIHPQQGSGDAKLTPESVQVGSTQNITLDYISHTTLENVYIWIYTPHNYAVDTEDPAFVMANGEEILLTATGDYGYLSSTGLPAGATQVIVDGGKGAVWGPLSFNRGDTFSRTIHNVAITDKPGAYTWDVHLATVDPVDRAGVVDGIGERNPNGLLGLTWSNHL